MIACLMIFSGKVQGVGFRAYIHRSAENLSLVGYVKNLSDGRVELLVQGTQEDIDRIALEIKSRFSSHISDVAIEKVQIDLSLKKFQILKQPV
jgi:acylphosphatase